MKKDNVILIGFMGTGKSTIGRLLAERLGWTYADSDARIEQEQGVTIPALFERDGEAGFRELETEVLLRIMAEGRQVIATGGGAVLAERNRRAMLDNGFVVTLQASKEAIIARVSGDTGRPLLQGNLEERVTTLMENRKHAYDFADFIIDTTGLQPDDIAARIVQAREQAFRQQHASDEASQ